MEMETIWHGEVTLDMLKKRNENTFASLLEIEFTKIGANYMIATIPIMQKHKQPIGIMNGGVSCGIAESVGSTAANYVIDYDKQYCVGLDINTNHIRPVSSGVITAKTFPYHIGRTTHVWSIEIMNENNKMVSINRITMAVKNR